MYWRGREGGWCEVGGGPAIISNLAAVVELSPTSWDSRTCTGLDIRGRGSVSARRPVSFSYLLTLIPSLKWMITKAVSVHLGKGIACLFGQAQRERVLGSLGMLAAVLEVAAARTPCSHLFIQ